MRDYFPRQGVKKDKINYIWCPKCGWDYVTINEKKLKRCGKCGTVINNKSEESHG
jgi:ribosomal protein S27AE